MISNNNIINNTITSNTNLKSIKQTVEIFDQSKNILYYSFELRPSFPHGNYEPKNQMVEIYWTKNRDKYMWFPNGNIRRIRPNGESTMWYPKPTISDAINFKKEYPNEKSFFEFFKDGSVFVKYFNQNYYFSGPEIGETIEWAFSVHRFVNVNYYFKKLEDNDEVYDNGFDDECPCRYLNYSTYIECCGPGQDYND
jgi:hypothetical protein